MNCIISKWLLPFALIILAGVSVSPAKEWRGIVPLKSTRADVEKLLGPPHDKYIFAYFLPEENIYFQYSQGTCKEGWNIPSDTVIHIVIAPNLKKPLADLNLDLTKYKKEPGDYDVADHFYYIDEEEGLAISVRNGIVQKYILGPTAKDNSLRCPKAESKYTGKALN